MYSKAAPAPAEAEVDAPSKRTRTVALVAKMNAANTTKVVPILSGARLIDPRRLDCKFHAIEIVPSSRTEKKECQWCRYKYEKLKIRPDGAKKMCCVSCLPVYVFRWVLH